MKNKFKWGSLLALVGFLSLATGTASATPIDDGFEFTFRNEGTINGSCGLFSCTANTYGTLKVDDTLWGAFTGTMELTGLIFYGVDDDSTWNFTDLSGLNSLFGTLTGLALLNPFDSPVSGGGSLDYTITGGTGLFAGASGDGHSGFGFNGSTYWEDGKLNIHMVPEPGVTTLLLAGLGMVGFVAWRRRRVQSQI